MASYNNNEDAPHEPDGVALIWNMKYQKESPEYIFHCQVKDEKTYRTRQLRECIEATPCLYIWLIYKSRVHLYMYLLDYCMTAYTPNANMADHLVGAWNELHEGEASEASVFCFDNASPEKSCFVDGLVCFISLCIRVFEFLNANRRE